MTYFEQSKARLTGFRSLSYFLVALMLGSLYMFLPDFDSQSALRVSIAYLPGVVLAAAALMILRVNFDKSITCPQCGGRLLRIGWKGEHPIHAVGLRAVVLKPRDRCRYCDYDLHQPIGSPVNKDYRYQTSGTREKPAEHGQDIGGYLDDAALRRRVVSGCQARQFIVAVGSVNALAVVGLAFAGLGIVSLFLVFGLFVMADRVMAAAWQDDEPVVCPDCGSRWQKIDGLPANMQLLSQFPLSPRFSCWHCGYLLKAK